MVKKIIFKKHSFFVLKLVVFLVFTGILVLFLVLFYYLKDLPRPENFKEGIITQSTKIYDRTGKIILYEISGEEKRTLVSLNKISPYIQKAVVAAEDKNFYSHKGFDIKALIRASLYDLKLKKPVQGGSTITQQLIRIYFLTRKKTLKRKTREIILTLEMERRYQKKQILEWYLNLVPFGGNIYGVEEASQIFFKKNASDITLAEAAVLASLIKSPSFLSPYGQHKDKLLERKDYILKKMRSLNLISEKEFQKAKNEKIIFQPIKTTLLAPHFTLFVKSYLENKYGRDFLNREGLKVITTIDYNLQKKIEELVKNYNTKQFGAFNAASIVVNAKTGEILSLVGSKDYFGKSYPDSCTPGKNCKFDPMVNIVFASRQPGSAFKPFVYAKALLDYLTPQTIIWDVKTEFNLNCSILANQEYGKYHTKCYHPRNYDERYIGPISLKDALAQSRNVPAVKVLYLVGLKNTLDFIKRFGITTLKKASNYGLSLVLGGGEVTLYDMVQGYLIFARDGEKIPLSFIKKIKNPKNQIIEDDSSFKPLRIIPSFVAREINDILSDNSARAPMFGWNSSLYIKGYDVAVKTGTTQNYKDAWVIGYTPNIIVGVWVGNNDNTPMKKYPSVSVAGPLWRDIITLLLDKFPKENFIKPKKRLKGIPVLDGVLTDYHSLLFYLRKNDPALNYWEKAIQFWLQTH